jgi:hypothetical protein
MVMSKGFHKGYSQRRNNDSVTKGVSLEGEKTDYPGKVICSHPLFLCSPLAYSPNAFPTEQFIFPDLVLEVFTHSMLNLLSGGHGIFSDLLFAVTVSNHLHLEASRNMHTSSKDKKCTRDAICKH